jgi:hypothetical protein
MAAVHGSPCAPTPLILILIVQVTRSYPSTWTFHRVNTATTVNWILLRGVTWNLSWCTFIIYRPKTISLKQFISTGLQVSSNTAGPKKAQQYGQLDIAVNFTSAIRHNRTFYRCLVESVQMGIYWPAILRTHNEQQWCSFESSFFAPPHSLLIQQNSEWLTHTGVFHLEITR